MESTGVHWSPVDSTWTPWGMVKYCKESVSVIIPKPGKPSYSVPKAFRPIALLNTLGKLIEKMLSNRIQHDMIAYNIVQQIQTSSGGFVNDPLKMLVYTSHISSVQDGLEVSRLALSPLISLSSSHPSTMTLSWRSSESKDFRYSW